MNRGGRLTFKKPVKRTNRTKNRSVGVQPAETIGDVVAGTWLAANRETRSRTPKPRPDVDASGTATSRCNRWAMVNAW